MGSRIIILDEHTANRIAAGEVVERPSAVAKELVENSLDAGATRIRVDVESGGRTLICVADNGCGMTREEVLLAIQRHATSKIRSAEDLDRVTTLGFRGEALPSIASVSRMEISTRPSDAMSGTRVKVDGGQVQGVEEAGVPPGTRVEVRDLFYNTPARLKFIKSDQTELGHIVELVGRLAIAHHSVAIRLNHNGREVFSSPGGPDPLAAMAAVWGKDRAARTVPVLFEAPGLRVTGFAAPPEVSRPNRSHEAFFVNRRPIVSRLLSHAVEEAYRSLLPDGRYPVAAIFIEMSPGAVDVNVHPTKAEVRFRAERDVHQAVAQAVRRALLSGRADVGVSLQPQTGMSGQAAGGTVRNGGGSAAQFLPSGIPARPSSVPQSATIPGIRLGVTVEEVRPSSAGEAQAWRLIGQIANTFIVGETSEGIVILDQHAAHERVIYEHLRRGMAEGGLEVQRLLLPTTVTLGAREAQILSEHLDELRHVGFEVEPFGGGTFLVRAVPAVAASASPETILAELASELTAMDGVVRASRESVLDAVITAAACKGAVKAGESLSPAEMRKLVQDFLDTESRYTCPHGRPVVVNITHGELLKRFKRA
ncbi:MAG: DNA mismatch repair endonuclease MutL [Armatimonadota bacterium]